MSQKTGVTLSQVLAAQPNRVRLASEHLMSGHAALALGVTSTFIYLVSAVVSLFASYNQFDGRQKLTLMLFGMLVPLAMTVIVRRRLETVIGVLGVGLALLAPLVGLTSVLTEGFDRGAAVGSLAVIVPLGGCGVVWAMARRYQRLLYVLAGCLVVALVCILISNERSAILGLIVGLALGAGLFWRFRLAEPSPWLRVIDLSTLTLLVISLVVYLALIVAPEQMGGLGVMLPEYYARRFALWREASAIMQDYLYTGSGLSATPMVLSTYLFLMHVPYYHHAHNLFLQVGIEQGMLGLVGLTGMVIGALWSTTIAMRRAHAYLALCAASAFAGLLALLVAGMFESDIYVSMWIAGMYLPFGFAWLIGQHDVLVHGGRRRTSNHLRPSDIVVGMLPVLLLLVLPFWPGADAQWLANRAAIEQTRAELTHFHYEIDKIQDAVRRDPDTNLDKAINFYQNALEKNPNNVTALRRLGQIELSRGEYDDAQQKLQSAFQIAPGQQATRQMLGETYAVEGDTERAVALWRTVDNSRDQWLARVWWYTYMQDADAAGRVQSVLEMLGILQDE